VDDGNPALDRRGVAFLRDLRARAVLSKLANAPPPAGCAKGPDARRPRAPTKQMGLFPQPARLGRERHERVAAERVVDGALHLRDLRVGTGLEAERQIRVRVRRTHEPPAAAGKDDARAVDVDRLVPLLEIPRYFLDHAELLAVGTGCLELGRGA